MRCQFLQGVWAVTSMNLLFVLSSPPQSSSKIHFNLFEGHIIVIKAGVVGSTTALNVAIDTGSSHSILNRKSRSKVPLSELGMPARLRAFGTESRAERIILRGLRLGPRPLTIACCSADLPWDKVDLVLGLDVLMAWNLLIDYEKKEIELGSTHSFPQQIPFEVEEDLLIAVIKIGPEIHRVSIDTGTGVACLYESRVGKAVRSLRGQPAVMQRLGGTTDLRAVVVPSLQLGDVTWRNLPVYLVLGAPHTPSTKDGALGLAALGIARVHFDFKEKKVSWERTSSAAFAAAE